MASGIHLHQNPNRQGPVPEFREFPRFEGVNRTEVFLISWPDGEFNLISAVNMNELLTKLCKIKGQCWDCNIHNHPHLFLKFKPNTPDINPWTSKEWPSKRLKVAADPAAELLSDFRALMSDEATADIELLCNGGSFKCHRLILAARSNYFKDAFNLSSNETRSGTLDLSNIESDLMKIIILYLYTGNLEAPLFKEASEKVHYLLRLSVAADFLLLSSLKDLVHEKIADLFKLPDLKIADLTHAAVKVMVEHLNDLHPCAQHAFMLWLFNTLDCDTYEEISFSEAFTRQLIDFGKSLHLKKDPLFIRRLRTISEFQISSVEPLGDIGPNIEGPDLDYFDTLVESVQDLYDVNLLQRVCLQWVYRPTEADNVRNGHLLMFVRHLLDKYQYDVTKQDYHGNTGLHCAVSRCSVPLVQMLSEVDQCRHIYNHMCDTPWNLATDKGDAAKYRFQPADVRQISGMLVQPDPRIPHWPLEDEWFEEMKDFYLNFHKVQFEFDPNDHQYFQAELRHSMFTTVELQTINIYGLNHGNLDEDNDERKRIWMCFKKDMRARAGCHNLIGSRLSYNNGTFRVGHSGTNKS